MTRLEKILVAILAVELAAGAFFLSQRGAAPRPPRPNFASMDPVTVADLEDRARYCRTAGQWRDLAAAYMAAGFFAEAEACCRRAAELMPDDADILYQWAFCLSRVGRTRESTEQFEGAVAAGHPEPARCWFFSGQNHLRDGEPEAAKRAFSRAKSLPMARYELARLHFRQGRPADALKLLDDILVEYPRAIEPNYLRHRIEREGKGVARAWRSRDEWQLAAHRLPTPFQGEWERVNNVRQSLGLNKLYYAALEAEQSGDVEQAERIMRQVVGMRGEPEAVERLADLCEKGGHRDEAVKLLENLLANGPSTHRLWLLGDMLEAGGEIERARRAWSRAADYRSQENIKDIYFKLALYAPKASGEATHYAALFHHTFGVEHFFNRRFADAAREFTQAVEKDAQAAHSWFYLGETYRMMQKADAARDAYERCLKIAPEHGRAHAALEYLKANTPKK